MIQVAQLEVLDLDEHTRQELDRNFLGSGYQRKIYVATAAEFRWRRPPRRCPAPMTIVPIPVDAEAAGCLRYLDMSGEVRTIEMKSGHSYFIPPNVAYEIETEGRGVFEMYTPAVSPSAVFEEEILPEDFFLARAGAGS